MLPAYVRGPLHASDLAVGIVIDDLALRRGEVIALAEDILCPSAILPGSPASAPSFEVSLGASLASIPLIVAALDLIELAESRLAAGAAAALLRSPYLPGADLAWASRAAIERDWLEAGRREVTLADAVAIKAQVPLIKSVSPNVDGQVQIIYGNQNWFTTYRGVSPEYFDIKRWFVQQGAVFAQDDVDRAADVCAIGRTVRDQLFGGADPIGKVMRVKGLPCIVVATLQPKGLSVSGQDQDDTIIMPYTTVQKKIKGIAWLDDVLCSAVSPDAVKLAGQQVAADIVHPG